MSEIESFGQSSRPNKTVEQIKAEGRERLEQRNKQRVEGRAIAESLAERSRVALMQGNKKVWNKKLEDLGVQYPEGKVPPPEERIN